MEKAIQLPYGRRCSLLQLIRLEEVDTGEPPHIHLLSSHPLYPLPLPHIIPPILQIHLFPSATLPTPPPLPLLTLFSSFDSKLLSRPYTPPVS